MTTRQPATYTWEGKTKMTTIEKRKAQSYDRLYASCVERAKQQAGGEAAFWICGEVYRTALVGQAILQLLYQQDEAIGGETVRELLAALYTRRNDDESLVD